MNDEYPTPLAQLMAERDRGQSWLGRKIGTSKQNIDKLAKGISKMSPEWAQKIAPVFNMDWRDFLEAHLAKQASSSVEPGVTVGSINPKPGDPIKDEDEALLIGTWRRLSVVKKAALFDHLGFDDLPSLRGQVRGQQSVS